jgi:hypothetical protein
VKKPINDVSNLLSELMTGLLALNPGLSLHACSSR